MKRIATLCIVLSLAGCGTIQIGGQPICSISPEDGEQFGRDIGTLWAGFQRNDEILEQDARNLAVFAETVGGQCSPQDFLAIVSWATRTAGLNVSPGALQVLSRWGLAAGQGLVAPAEAEVLVAVACGAAMGILDELALRQAANTAAETRIEIRLEALRARIKLIK